MKPRHFLQAIEEERIVQAIREAEQRTSGEIRVSVTSRRAEDPVAVGQKEFDRLEMSRTRERNGILIFIAPKSRTFAVIGDTAIHEKCGQSLWNETAAVLQTHFKDGRFTEGLIAVIERLGVLLAEHFPRREDDTNELSDDIVQS